MKVSTKAVMKIRSDAQPCGGFQAAAEWDIEQQRRMTPSERRAAARQLRQRVYGVHPKDVHACHGFLGLETLIRNKESAGRPKDLDDLAYLRQGR